MSDSKRREHICFTGYVQGVGFRYRLSHLAQYYGVTGWVRNEYDGSVSAELQGLVGEIDQIIQQLKQDRYCLLYTSPSPRDRTRSRMPSSA